MPVQLITLPANGLTFNTLTAGPETGDLVLLLHGFPQFADSWTPILEPLAAAGFRAVAVDQRGYSPTARPPKVEDYAIDQLTEDVLAIADALNASRFHLAGHDWGGLVAWHLAAQHPQRLHTLTVLSTPHINAFQDALRTSLDQMNRSKYLLLFKSPSPVPETALLAFNAKALRAAYQGIVPAPQVESNVRRLSEPGALTAALNWYRALSPSLRIGRIAVPTLYLWGDADIALGEAAAQATASWVDAPYRFERLPGRSHWLLEEAPEEIAAHLLQHLPAKAAP